MANSASVTESLLGVPGRGHAIVQIGFAVRSIPDAASVWAATAGAGPFFRVGDGPVELGDVTHRGVAAAWSHSTSVGQWGRLMVELTELHSASPVSLAEQLGVGRYGLHHVAWLVDDLDAESGRLEGLGFPMIMKASVGPQEFRFHDATDTLGYRVEIYHGAPPVPAFFGAVARAAANWDGRDVLRSIAALDLDGGGELRPIPVPDNDSKPASG